MQQKKPASPERFQEFVDRGRKVFGDRFQYFPEEFYGISHKTKLLDTITGEVFYQKAGRHLEGYLPRELGVLDRARSPERFEKFVKKAREVFGDRFQYFPEEYHGTHGRTKILDTVTGKIYYQIAEKHCMGQLPKELRALEPSKKPRVSLQWTEEEVIQRVYKLHPHLTDVKIVDKKGYYSIVYAYCPLHEKSFKRNFYRITENSGCYDCNKGVPPIGSKDDTPERAEKRYQENKETYKRKWRPKGYHFIYYPAKSYYPYIKFKDVATGIVYEQNYLDHKTKLPKGFVKYTKKPSLNALFEVFAKNCSILYEDRYEYSRKSFKGFHEPTEARDKVTGVLYTVDPIEHYYGKSPGLLDHPIEEVVDVIKQTFPNIDEVSYDPSEELFTFHCTLDDLKTPSERWCFSRIDSDECLCRVCAEKRFPSLLPKPTTLLRLKVSQGARIKDEVRSEYRNRFTFHPSNVLAKGQGLSLMFDRRHRVAFYYDVDKILKGYPKALDNLVPKHLAPINLSVKSRLTPQPVVPKELPELPSKPLYFRSGIIRTVNEYFNYKEARHVLSPHKILILPAGRPALSYDEFERHLKELGCTVDESNPNCYKSAKDDFRIWLASPPQIYSPIEGYELTTVTVYGHVTKTEIGALAYRRWVKTLNQELLIDSPLAERQEDTAIEHIETFTAVNDLYQYEFKKSDCTYTYKDFYTTDAENIRFVLVIENETETVVRMYFDLDRQFPAAAIQKAAKDLGVRYYLHDLNIGSGVVPKSFGYIFEEIPTEVWVSENFEYSIEDSCLNVEEFQAEYKTPRLSGESDDTYMKKLGYAKTEFQPKIRILL